MDNITSKSFILNSYILNGDGSGDIVNEKNLIDALKDERPAWVHLDGMNPETRDWLKKNISYLDPLILNGLLAEETRPRISETNDGALIILRGVNLNEGSDPTDMISVRIWVDKHRIISIHRRPLKAIADIQKRLAENTGPRNTGEIVIQIAQRLFERMEPVLLDLDDRIDTIEERILENPDPSERQEIVAIRKNAILLRRYIAPHKEVLNALRLSEQGWLETSQKRYIQESLDRITRYVEDLDAMRERAQVIKDELANMLSDRLNKNLYILSIISAIFLPLGFFTGLMGINIGGMPGVDNGNAFWIFTGSLILMVAIQMIIFKKLKWF